MSCSRTQRSAAGEEECYSLEPASEAKVAALTRQNYNKKGEFDQEIPQSQTTDQPIRP